MEELNNIKLFIETSLNVCEEEEAKYNKQKVLALEEQKKVDIGSSEYYRLEGAIGYLDGRIAEFTGRKFAYERVMDALQNEINSVESYIESLLPANTAETYGLMPWEA